MKTINPAILLISFLLGIAVFPVHSADGMKVTVIGKTYKKREFKSGTELFLNRNYVIENLPDNSEFNSFSFLASAGGKDIIDEGIIIPSSDGTIYVIARSAANITGWTKVADSDFNYDNGKSSMSVFHKSVTANQEVEIPNVNDFQGASPLAKTISYINPDAASESPIRVEDENNAFTPRLLVDGARLFISDPSYSFEGVPEDFSGFKFLASKANVDEEATIIPEEDGKVYAIARAGGIGMDWTLVPNSSFYSDYTCDEMVVYERISLAGERIPLPKGNDLEGVSPLAKEIEYVMNELLPSQMSVTVEAPSSVFQNRYFNNGAALFKNRTYYVTGIPSRFTGFQFLASNGGEADENGTVLIPSEDGHLYVMARNTLTLGDGWEIIPNTEFTYNDPNGSFLSVFQKEVQAGERVSMPTLSTSDFRGVTPLAKKIVYGTTLDVRGELIDIRVASAGNSIFPQNSYNFTNDIPSYLKNKEYATSLIEYAGVTHIKSEEPCEVYIALHYNNLISDDWENTGDSFYVAPSKRYYIYKCLYNPLQEWMEIPGAAPSGGMVKLVFADKIIWDNPRPLPESVVIAQSAYPKNYYITNPSLAILPDGDYIASCTGAYRTGAKNAVTIFRSADKGKTWTPQTINNVVTNYGSLFVHNNDLYLMGTSGVHGNVTIRKSTDKGVTWTEPADASSGLLVEGEFHSAPVPVVEHGGRIWRAMETNPSATDKKDIFVMSAPASSDLLKASNWTCTNKLAYRTNWISGGGKMFKQWLEGNVVVDPQGRILNVLRVDEESEGKTAAVATVTGISELNFNPATDIIEMPGGGKKFTIRYDETSRKYWSLTNIALPEDIGKRHDGIYNSGIHCGLLRNRLALIHSSNLRNWTVAEMLIEYESPFFYGFQYIDWQFDGDDIVAVSRTAFEDVRGLPSRQHDANYFLFHRFADFRNNGVSIKPEKEDPAFTMTFDNQTINIQFDSSHTFDVQVYNTMGVCVNRGRNQYNISTRGWTDGVYLVCIIQNGKVMSQKIVVH